MNCNKCKYRSIRIDRFARGRRIEARPYCEYHIREIKDFHGCAKYKKKRGSIKVSISGSTNIFYLGDKIEIYYKTHNAQALLAVFENYHILNTCIKNTDDGLLIDYRNIYKIRKV